MDHDGNRSNPYHPDPVHCCERCAFGSGKHHPACEYVAKWRDLLAPVKPPRA
jgi:hypothetical protein